MSCNGCEARWIQGATGPCETCRIATLESDLKASREREHKAEAARAKALAFYRKRLSAQRRAARGLNAAHNASREREAALAAALAEIRRYIELCRTAGLHPDVETYFGAIAALTAHDFAPNLAAHDARVRREAKIEEAQWFEARALANGQRDGNIDVSISEIRRRIAALKAEVTEGTKK